MRTKTESQSQFIKTFNQQPSVRPLFINFKMPKRVFDDSEESKLIQEQMKKKAREYYEKNKNKINEKNKQRLALKKQQKIQDNAEKLAAAAGIPEQFPPIEQVVPMEQEVEQAVPVEQEVEQVVPVEQQEQVVPVPANMEENNIIINNNNNNIIEHQNVNQLPAATNFPITMSVTMNNQEPLMLTSSSIKNAAAVDGNEIQEESSLVKNDKYITMSFNLSCLTMKFNFTISIQK